MPKRATNATRKVNQRTKGQPHRRKRATNETYETYVTYETRWDLLKPRAGTSGMGICFCYTDGHQSPLRRA
jgi:hypothetical protein